MDFGAPNLKSPFMALNLEETKKIKGRNPRKLGLSNTKGFENHCSGGQAIEVGGWGAWSVADNAGGGIWCNGFMRQRMGDNSRRKSSTWQRVTDPMSEILASVDRSDSDDPCGGVAGQR